MNPAFSVIVPVHRTESTLRECLESLLGQSFGNFEILVIDDASPDGAWDIIAEYAKSDARIRAYRNAAVQNLYDARIRGFELALGEYVVVCDSDDAMSGEALAAYHRTISGKGAKPDMLHGRARELGGKRPGLILPNCERFRIDSGPGFVAAMMRSGRGWNIWGKAFRGALVKRCLRLLPRNKNWFMMEDLVFCTIFGSYANTYVGIRDTVYLYRWPSSGMTGDFQARANGQMEALVFLRETLPSLPGGADCAVDLRRVTLATTTYCLRRLPPDERRSFRDRVRIVLGDEIWSEMERMMEKRGDAFSPGGHFRNLARLGVREYAIWWRTLLAAARRAGVGECVRRLIGRPE